MTYVRPTWDESDITVPDDIPAALKDLGIEVLRASEREATIRCPQHLARTGKEDRHPSFSINLSSGAFICYSCGYKGGFARLVTDVLAVNESEASAWIRSRAGIMQFHRIVEPAEPVRTDVPALSEADLALFTDPPPSALASRKLTLPAARRYGVRWDLGQQAWILPIRDPDSHRLWGWQEKRDGHYFRNRPAGIKKSETLFGLRALAGETAILVESPLDAPRFASAGIDGAVASFGAAVSQRQLELLCSRVGRIVLALDNDREGWRQTKEIYTRYSWARDRMSVFAYPADGPKDPGEMTNAQLHTALAQALSQDQRVTRVRFR